MQVTDAVFAFGSANRDVIAPFLIITGKICALLPAQRLAARARTSSPPSPADFTTPSHHQRYLEAANAFHDRKYGAYTSDRHTVLFGWQVVSHSVPVHAAYESKPEHTAHVTEEILQILGL